MAGSETLTRGRIDSLPQVCNIVNTADVCLEYSVIRSKAIRLWYLLVQEEFQTYTCILKK